MARRKPIADNAVVVDDGLTIKQRLFVDHYIVCMNGTEAARLAGYDGDNATLAVTASQNLRNHNILREVDRRLKEYAMSANEVLIHLTDIARGDLGDVLTASGGIDATEARRRGKTHMIKRYKVKTVTKEDEEIHETEIEMYDRLDALKTLAKFHSLLVDRVKIDDWRSQAIEAIKAGRLDFAALAQTFDHSLAKELFQQAGVPVDDVT